jgi:hypothetical protein
MITVWAIEVIGSLWFLANQDYPRVRPKRMDAAEGILALGFLIWGILVLR